MAGPDLFLAVPVAASGASLSPSSDGGGVLSLRAEAPAGFAGWLVRRLRLERCLRFQLDRVGLCYFRHVDGKRTLADIQRALCTELELPRAEVRRAVIEFTALLMRKNLVALRWEQP